MFRWKIYSTWRHSNTHTHTNIHTHSHEWTHKHRYSVWLRSYDWTDDWVYRVSVKFSQIQGVCSSDNLHFPIALSTRFMLVSRVFCFYFPYRLCVHVHIFYKLFAFSLLHSSSLFLTLVRLCLSAFVPNQRLVCLCVSIRCMLHEPNVKKAHTDSFSMEYSMHVSESPLTNMHAKISRDSHLSEFKAQHNYPWRQIIWKIFHSFCMRFEHIRELCSQYGCAYWT